MKIRKSCCWCAALMLGAVPMTRGGQVRFEPAVQIVDTSLGTTATVDVYVESSVLLGAFDSVDMIVKSEHMAFRGFVFDADFKEMTTWLGEEFHHVQITEDGPAFAIGLYAGGFSMLPVLPPVKMGTITLDVAGLAFDTFSIEVNPELDQNISGLGLAGSWEPLSGFAQVIVMNSVEAQCTQDADCVDDDRCTENYCYRWQCAVRLADVDCDDGDPCTQDYCALNQCHSRAIHDCCQSDAACDDGDICTTDVCDGGECIHQPVGACDDGDPCTIGDSCQMGQCAGLRVPDCCTVDANCDDGNPCTRDACTPGGCRHEPRNGPCDDHDPCTVGDACDDGECRGIRMDVCCEDDTDCDDINVCTLDYCVDGGCEHRAVTGTCDDGDPCTLYDWCFAGQCWGEPVEGCCHNHDECDDGNDCTIEACVVGFCQYVQTISSCDDGDPCTVFDRCHFGECVGEILGDCCQSDADCDDDDDCTEDWCLNQVCIYTQIDDCEGVGGLNLPGEEPDGPAPAGSADEVNGEDLNAAGGQGAASEDAGAGQPPDDEEPEPEAESSTVNSPGGLMCGAVGMWMWFASLAGLVAMRRRKWAPRSSFGS